MSSNKAATAEGTQVSASQDMDLTLKGPINQCKGKGTYSNTHYYEISKGIPGFLQK